jgi:hypothetical protein
MPHAGRKVLIMNYVELWGCFSLDARDVENCDDCKQFLTTECGHGDDHGLVSVHITEHHARRDALTREIAGEGDHIVYRLSFPEPTKVVEVFVNRLRRELPEHHVADVFAEKVRIEDVIDHDVWMCDAVATVLQFPGAGDHDEDDMLYLTGAMLGECDYMLTDGEYVPPNPEFADGFERCWREFRRQVAAKKGA